MRDSFFRLHPAVRVCYFCLVLVLTMLCSHPFFLTASLAGALACLLCLPERQGMAVSGGAALVLLMGLCNALFQPMGGTLLWTLPGGRGITLEALLCGLCAGERIAAVLLWFVCMGCVIHEEDVVMLTGGRLPRLTLLFTMILRFLPAFRCTVHSLLEAQQGIRRGMEGGESRRERAISIGRIFGAFLSLSLEDAVGTAASMKSRGFGLPGRGVFCRRKATAADGGWASAIVLLGIGGGVAAAGLSVSWYPTAALAPVSPVWGACVLLLCFLPVLSCCLGGAPWRTWK